MVGYTREELLSGRLRSRDMTPEEYRRLDEKGLRDLAETGACAPFEKEYVRKDGSRVPILLGAIMLEGAQHRGISFVLDLTDRDKVQKALSESEAQREAILEASFYRLYSGHQRTQMDRARATPPLISGAHRTNRDGRGPSIPPKRRSEGSCSIAISPT